MRRPIVWRFAAVLFVMAALLVFPQFDAYTPGVLAQGEQGEGKSQKDNDGKKNEHGKDKGEEKKKDKDKTPRQDEGVGVAEAAQYAVDVQCEFDVDANSTTCSFTGIAPPDARDISHVDLAQDEVCAEVTGGTYEYVDPDPNTQVTGYKSRGSEGSFTLVLQGEVATAGTTTYWFKTGDGVYSATGPGLSCREFTSDLALGPTQEALENNVVVTNSTGALLVRIYLCTDVPEDTTDFDWFGECDPEAGVHEFTLSEVNQVAEEPLVVESDPSGDTAFGALAPGRYELEMVDTTWCHAVSDRVTAEGHVVIQAGQRATVWGFICEDEPSA